MSISRTRARALLATLAGCALLCSAARPLADQSASGIQLAEVRASATAPRTEALEVRGLWVLRSSLASSQSIANLVRSARASGFNTLFVQVRGRGEAFYRSRIDPRADELTPQPAS